MKTRQLAVDVALQELAVAGAKRRRFPKRNWGGGLCKKKRVEGLKSAVSGFVCFKGIMVMRRERCLYFV